MFKGSSTCDLAFDSAAWSKNSFQGQSTQIYLDTDSTALRYLPEPKHLVGSGPLWILSDGHFTCKNNDILESDCHYDTDLLCLTVAG